MSLVKKVIHKQDHTKLANRTTPHANKIRRMMKIYKLFKSYFGGYLLKYVVMFCYHTSCMNHKNHNMLPIKNFNKTSVSASKSSIQDDDTKTESLNESLLNAAKFNMFNELKDLLGKGADINYKNENHQTSIMIAAERGHEDVVKYLLAQEATLDDQDIKGNTALILAALNNYFEIVKLLVSKGAEDALSNLAGQTVFDFLTEDLKKKLQNVQRLRSISNRPIQKSLGDEQLEGDCMKNEKIDDKDDIK